MRNKAKVLVVDDQMAVALTMVYLLTRAGFVAEAALSAEKALQLAQMEDFDLITLDINMPGIGGFELFQRLKEIPHSKRPPVIFVSGFATDKDRQRALELGAVDFVEKPFEATDFIFRIVSHTKAKDWRSTDSLSEKAGFENTAFN